MSDTIVKPARKPRGPNYSEELKRKVLAMAAKCGSQRQAAEAFNVSLGSVQNWKRAADRQAAIGGMDTRATIGEEGVRFKPLRLRDSGSAPSKFPATSSSDLLDFFAGRKACCVACGDANAGAFRAFVASNPGRNVSAFHCVGCGASLTDSLLEHYEQNSH